MALKPGNILRWLFGFILLAFVADAVLADDTFTNPIVRRGADPWVIRWNGEYYFCQSRSNAVWVNAATNLEDIGKGHWAYVWRPPEGKPYSREVWAPELHFLQGQWYIYVAADDGDNFNHRMYVLQGTSLDPTQPFTLKGKIAVQTDRWAIDGTVLEMPDARLYFIWSGWEGAENVAQNLYIAPMSNPWTIDGERVCIPGRSILGKSRACRSTKGRRRFGTAANSSLFIRRPPCGRTIIVWAN
jgi:GH43 family beta-xylosidase